MCEMTLKEIMPSVSRAQAELAYSIKQKRDIGMDAKAETKLLDKGSRLIEALDEAENGLEQALRQAESAAAAHDRAAVCRDSVIPSMAELRSVADALEAITPSASWPFPDYEKLLLMAP